MPVNALPINTPSLRLRHLVVEEAARMMELNGEPSTRRWLPSHVYAGTNEATSRMRYLISCYTSPGDPRLGPFVLAVEHVASEALLGHVGFSPLDSDVEVSYAIAEDSRRRGYGAEALLYSCQWAAAIFNLPCILAISTSVRKRCKRPEKVPMQASRTANRQGIGRNAMNVERFRRPTRVLALDVNCSDLP